MYLDGLGNVFGGTVSVCFVRNAITKLHGRRHSNLDPLGCRWAVEVVLLHELFQIRNHLAEQTRCCPELCNQLSTCWGVSNMFDKLI